VGIEVNFEGKVALVTGASSGLGARFAKILAQGGAQVVLAARRIDRMKELRAEIEADGGAAHMVQLDVTDYGSIKSALAHAETEAGHIDILVNNSGVSTTQRLIDVTPDDYQYVMDTNLRGAFFVAQEAAKRMILRAKADPSRQHRIINIASVAGLRVLSQIGVYCMSKAGVVQMTKAMALEWGRYVRATSRPRSIASTFAARAAASWSTCCRANASASRKIWMPCCSCWRLMNHASSTARS
jgi:NAD(P)-dependent dehydrogenase (short-subunit alcohol dehydrogenase family)